MVDVEKNEKTNEQLRKLYQRVQPDFLDEYEKCYGERKPFLLDFGIVDEKQYDKDNGILIVLKEARDWNFEKDGREDYLELVRGIANKGNGVNAGREEKQDHVKMNMWYNLGRWITAINDPQKPTEEIAEMYGDALQALNTAAITNINKISGGARSDSQYDNLAKSDIAVGTFKEEVSILNPKYIIFCQTQWWFLDEYLDELRGQGRKLIEMCHPAYWGKTTIEMIKRIKGQL